jgi:hypothetical protein
MDHNISTSPQIQSKEKDIISYFGNDADFVFVYKKTEKLTTAIYLITNLFSDSEPMKWTLRTKMGDVLSFIAGYKNIVLSRHVDFSAELKLKALEVVSLLEISSRSGLVSAMNFSILEQEFLKLVDTVDAHNISHKELQSHNLSKSFFYVPQTPVQPVVAPVQNPTQFEVMESPKQQIPTDHIKPEQTSHNTVTKTPGSVSDNNPFKRTNRQEAILSLLRKRSDLSIKDIAGVVKGCGEKTIQRELISLISLGLITKVGERRWSRYSIAQ